jgi:hypothetical protein
VAGATWAEAKGVNAKKEAGAKAQKSASFVNESGFIIRSSGLYRITEVPGGRVHSGHSVDVRIFSKAQQLEEFIPIARVAEWTQRPMGLSRVQYLRTLLLFGAVTTP